VQTKFTLTSFLKCRQLQPFQAPSQASQAKIKGKLDPLLFISQFPSFLRLSFQSSSTTMAIENPILHPFLFLYQLMQWFLDKLLSPNPPQPGVKLGRPKIAVIGAGLTGVSAASHCVGHGFDVQLFEAGPREQLGGIWSAS
jgi:hypothetical protein